MCAECLALTRRSYRAGAWFFYSLAALFALMAPFIIWSDFRRFGTRPAVQDAAILIGVTSLAAGMAYCIQHFGAKVR
jgi:hypothetical protein